MTVFVPNAKHGAIDGFLLKTNNNIFLVYVLTLSQCLPLSKNRLQFEIQIVYYFIKIQ